MKTISIIGGGIGGLTTAIALDQRHFEVNVFESAQAWKPVGAGILLGENALSVFEQLNIKDQIVQKGWVINSGGITDENHNTISSLADSEFIAIHRADLHQVLLDNLGDAEIHLGKRFDYSKVADYGRIKAFFEDGTRVKSEILIGADGINSRVRKQIFPDTVYRKSGQICWRAVVDYQLPEDFKHRMAEAWGGKARFGIVPYGDGKVYWFAVYAPSAGEGKISMDDFPKLFSHFAPLVQNLIKATDLTKVHVDELNDIKPSKDNWFQNQICLIGDAAHATTPNLGQGACQAIEDGLAIAEAIAKYDDFRKYDDMKTAFQQFQKVRRAKVNYVVNTSWQIGKIAHLNNKPLRKLRNGFFRLIPPSVSNKQMKQLFDMSYLQDI